MIDDGAGYARQGHDNTQQVYAHADLRHILAVAHHRVEQGRGSEPKEGPKANDKHAHIHFFIGVTPHWEKLVQHPEQVRGARKEVSLNVHRLVVPLAD